MFLEIIREKIDWYVFRMKMRELNDEYKSKKKIDEVGYMRILCRRNYWKQYNWRILNYAMSKQRHCIMETDRTMWYWKIIADLPKRYVYSSVEEELREK